MFKLARLLNKHPLKDGKMNQYKLENLNNSKQEINIETYLYIGSDINCGLQLSDSLIEKKHALLDIRENKLFIKDLRSQNGVYVNGARVFEALLNDADVVKIGHTEFLVHDQKKIADSFSVKSLNIDWQNKLNKLAHTAKTNFPILLLGPSGTGKDILAQALHQHSNQAKQIFLSVNCSALTETLIESELFGHIKGSFTGAVGDRKGAFETARNGTLFLDEIGDLPFTLQAKLLRALENNEIRAVGSDRPIKTNVRIIAATHQNLYQKIQEGSFRADLFYRLNVITIEVPQLKNRIEDFESLLYQFAKHYRVRFSHQAILDLKKHDWPGNIRELKNVVARASALFPKESITESHINFLILKNENLAITQLNNMASSNSTLSVIKEIEKQMIIKRLYVNGGNQKRTANDLGMPKSTLNDRIKSYKINVEELKSRH